MSRPPTSADHLLGIAEVPAGQAGGLIGITFAPGRWQPGAPGGGHRRDLGADLDAIAAWGAACVVTLVEPHELLELGIERLGSEVRRRHMAWHHWPIQDYGVPGPAFETAWPGRSAALRSLLANGNRALIHCKGGLGRGGSVAARLLVEMGASPERAIAGIRLVRPGAIETAPQEAWVAAGRPAPGQP